MDAVPAFGNLNVLIGGPGQNHLDAFLYEQRAQPKSQIQRDVLFYHGANHDTWIPELSRITGWAAAMPRIDRDHVGRGHDERGLRSRCPSRWHVRKQDDPGREHDREARETKLVRSIRREIKKSSVSAGRR